MESALLIVKEYIESANNFFDNKSTNFIINNKYSINDILFLIGSYDLNNELMIFLDFKNIINYYKYINIFHYAMIGAIYKNNSNIIIQLEKYGLNKTKYINIYKQYISKPDSEFINLLSLFKL